MTFDELNLEDELLDALWDMHFDECTPVQAQTIPVIMEGKDVISCAQTGTGKTAAYILPLLNNLLIDNHAQDKVNAIIMAPTRELAQQIDQQMEGFSYYVPSSSVCIYGGNDGVAWAAQEQGLTKGADIVIATPGRLLSHINLHKIDFSGVKYFILDEADRMLDMGFFDDIMAIVSHLPKDRQTILFSATMPQELRRLAKTFMRNPVEVNIAISRPPETIHQMAAICHEGQKTAIVQYLLGGERHLSKVIIFVGKKAGVKELYHYLVKGPAKVRQMHSDLSQKEREEVMLDFRNGKVDILIATDIVARGIDVDDIPLVINYDVPRDAEDYVHRIGRTARGGSGVTDAEEGPQSKSGEAITLVSEKDQHFFNKIEKFLDTSIERLNIQTTEINTLENDHPTNTRSASHRVSRKRKNHSSKPNSAKPSGDKVRSSRQRPGRGKH